MTSAGQLLRLRELLHAIVSCRFSNRTLSNFFMALNGRRLAVLITFLTSTIALFAAAIAANAMSAEKRASQIIDDLRSTSAAKNPVEKFKLLQRKYGGDLKAGPCVSGRCYYEIEVNNRFLARLHLADYAEMTTVFYFDNDSFFGAITNYRIARDGGNSPVVHVQEDSCQGQCPGWLSLGVNPHGRRSVEVWNGMVEFNATATYEQRQAARSFNFRCFLPFKRCTDISDLLPEIWSRNPDGSLRCQFRTSGDASNDWDQSASSPF
jgi:hypothetical protein